MAAINETHDPALRSWVESANDPATDFPIQNLPFGVFSRAGGEPRVGVAIGDQILDVTACLEANLLESDAAFAAAEACRSTTLNALMAADRLSVSGLRLELSRLLRDEESGGPGARATAAVLVPMAEARMHVPADIGDYTDFYASIDHATNIGKMFRPDNPLLPNYRHVPIGYHGRASSIVASGASVRRPLGQTKPADAETPVFGPTKLLDYEAEVGFFVAGGNRRGEPIPIARAEDHIFGFCLVNDWSARDIQAWEYQPLGPFLAKNFATTVSPWVVTAEALAPFRVPARARGADEPAPLPYLFSPGNEEEGGLALTLDVLLLTERMRAESAEPFRVSRGSLADMYWTPAQMLAHHASNGCNLRPGDLLASGTVSGSSEDSRGCLMERTSRGANPVALPNGEERRFLQDGDEVVMRGCCRRIGFVTIGFGECRGIVEPAVERSH
ncbi:MAG: fumarylacetoacetase [Gemmatimonadaceae bacterium]|nr:fumarylacetoacetase [Gemmatimonadaceae bacterium]